MDRKQSLYNYKHVVIQNRSYSGLQDGDSTPFLNGWTYRKSITLSRGSGALTNYPMKILVGESSGATGEDVDCNSHVQTDFRDLRFTKANGTTLLDHWIESISGSTPNQLATVWVEFDSIATTDTKFYMYYGNSSLVDPVDAPGGALWQRYSSNPVLTVGDSGAWDDFWVLIHSIFKDGSTYYAYYAGCKNDFIWKIGFATSTDGKTWTKYGGNPCFTPGGAGKWDDYSVSSPIVWKEGTNTWYMLYAGEADNSGAWKIGMAYSSDGQGWIRYSEDYPQVDVTPAAWDSFFVAPGTTVFKEGSTYYLYYWGGNSADAGNGNWKIGLATSPNLVAWTKSGNNPLLSPTGTTWEQGGVLEPFVKQFGSTYYMWYMGENSGATRTRLGMATSSSKDSGWTRYSYNPVLINNRGAWDSNWTETPVLVDFGTEWRLYFGGSQGGAATPRMQSGYARYQHTGSGYNTFTLFEQFLGVTIDTAKWDNTDTYTEAEGDAYKYAANTNLTYILKSQNNYTAPLAVEARCKVGADWSNEYSWLFAVLFDSAWATTGYLGGHFKDASNDYTRIYKFGTGATNNGTNESVSADTYYRYSMRVGSTDQKLFVDNTQKGTITTSIQTNPTKVILGCARAVGTSDYTSYFDWVAIRDYRDTEPTWGSWSIEDVV